MTGQLKLENTYPNKIVTIAGTDTSSLFELIIGTDRQKSPALSLTGGTNTRASAGSIQLRAAKADSSGSLPYLLLNPDGSLIHSANGSNNDLGGSAIVESSLTNENNWYYKLASGFIVQGGQTSTTQFTNVTGGSSFEFTLPISFSSFYSVVPLPQVASPFIVNCVSYNVSMSKMKISMDKDNSYNFTMRYVAIGK